MKISQILKERQSGVSFEFFPPKTDKGKGALARTVEALKRYNPLYASMTYGAGGTEQANTEEAVGMLLSKTNFVVMPHLTCIGAEAEKINSLLEEYKGKGIENIMALRGDPPLDGFDFSFKDFSYAESLVQFIKKKTSFCIGVAVYPEGHIEAKTLAEDLNYTKQKIDAGADFCVTQMFFDNDYFYSFLDRMEKKAISLPVLPGILPLTNLKKVKGFTSVCKATVPKDIEQRLERFKDNPLDQEKAGIEITIKQCQDLISQGIRRIHFFTLNKPQVMETILDALSISNNNGS